MDRLGVEEGEVITHGMVTKAIEKAQVRVESHNFDIRKHLLEYDDVVNKQREVIYGLRRDILVQHETEDIYNDYIDNAVETLMEDNADPEQAPDFWNMDEIALRYRALVLAPLPLSEEEYLDLGYEAMIGRLQEFARERRETKRQRIGTDISSQLERFVLLQVIDEHWRDHLNQLIMLRSGIGLRSYGQRDPLVEYKAESFQMFEGLIQRIEHDAVQLFFRAELAAPPPPPEQPLAAEVQAQHQAVSAYQRAGGGDVTNAATAAPLRPQPEMPGSARPVQRQAPKVGRNDPCPCGSGKKYKRCCGR
jgi:preprotein translocase subunit SecA